jgi:hypothetical protein
MRYLYFISYNFKDKDGNCGFGGSLVETDFKVNTKPSYERLVEVAQTTVPGGNVALLNFMRIDDK